MSETPHSLSCMHKGSVSDFRRHALTPATIERPATMLCVPSIRDKSLHHLFAVTRDPAAELLGTSLFAHDVVTISVSAHNDAGHTDIYLPEVFACIDRLLGEGVPMMLREVDSGVLNTRATYFKLLVDGERFYAPSPLQDAYLAKHYDARRLLAPA